MSTIIDDSDIKIEELHLGPFGTNMYSVVCRETGESLVVDAPGEVDRILGLLRDTKPKYILLTHDHFDHTGALEELRKALGVPLAAHVTDSRSLRTPPEILLEDGNNITLGKLILKVIHTPGHTPGSLCFYTGKYLLAGDTLFPGGPGKTSSPGNFRQLVESITQKIYTLPDETWIFPGHGEATTVEKSKEEYAIFASRSHSPNICGDVLWLSS